MSTGPVLLSELGTDPASMLRLSAQFDVLEEQEASADRAARFAALVAQCPVGVRWPGGTVVRYDASGRLDPSGRRRGSAGIGSARDGCLGGT